MKIYSKVDQEYIENGYYKIDNQEYMSIWTFKNHNLIVPNTNEQNGNEGKELKTSGVKTIETSPDFGPFRIIHIYPLEDLKKYYDQYF